MQKFKEHPIMTLLSFFSFCLGIYFIFGDPNVIKSTLSILIGAGLIISGLSKMLTGSYYINGVRYEHKNSSIILDCVLGIIIISNVDFVVEILSAIYFLLIPAFIVYSSKDRKEMFLKELPKFIFGIVILLIELSFVYKIFLVLVGIALIVFGFTIIGLILKSIKYSPFEDEKFYHNRLKDDDEVIDVRCDDEN